MTRPHIVHLIDDTTAGGVMRVLDHILNSPDLALTARHSLHPVKRGALSFSRLDADMVVSHLSVSWRSLPGLVALRAAHADKPLIHVEHSYTEAFTAQNVTAKRRFHALLRIAYSLFDRVVAVSEAQGRWLTGAGLVGPESVRVIASAVDLSAFFALPDANKRTRVIGAIGRLDRQKGFDTLIQAFRACPDPDLQLHIFGDGPERKMLEELADEDARIMFMGHVADTAAAMSSVDAVAMPSRWEAYGLVALEARAARRPLLAGDVDGLKDHIAHGAICVRGTNVESWTQAILSLTAPGVEAYVSASAFADVDGGGRFVAAWRDLITELLVAIEPSTMLATAA